MTNPLIQLHKEQMELYDNRFDIQSMTVTDISGHLLRTRPSFRKNEEMKSFITSYNLKQIDAIMNHKFETFSGKVCLIDGNSIMSTIKEEYKLIRMTDLISFLEEYKQDKQQ